MKWIGRIVAGLFVVLLVGGIVTNSADSDFVVLRRYGEMMFLWVAAAVVALYSRRGLARLFVGALIGFGSEILGVATGIPYGRYHYTSTLGVSVAGVPVVMLAAWMVLLSYAWFLASQVTSLQSRHRLSAALAMTLFDLLIDPVAIGPMHLWVWDQLGIYYGVPFVNFIGWFVVSWVALLPMRPEHQQHSASHLVGVGIVTFFTIIALRSELIGVGLIGIGLLVADGILCRQQWVQYFAAVKLHPLLRANL